MSDTNTTLKQENSLLVRVYLVANLIIFWALSTGTELTEIFKADETNIDKIIEQGFISLIITIFTVVICGLFSPEFKYILIFKRFKYTLPGHRAFSSHMKKYPRINPINIESKFGEIPSDPIEQNRLWYKIYKKQEDDKTIRDTHKNFLLLREVTGLSFLFLIILGGASFFVLSNYKIAFLYTFILLIMLILCSRSAQNYGIRLVTNVLAVESVTEE